MLVLGLSWMMIWSLMRTSVGMEVAFWTDILQLSVERLSLREVTKRCDVRLTESLN